MLNHSLCQKSAIKPKNLLTNNSKSPNQSYKILKTQTSYPYIGELISLENHPLIKTKRMAKLREPYCHLMNPKLDIYSCRKTNPDCETCEVTSHYKEVRINLTELSLTGSIIHSKTF